jgi:hypothetical protein
LARKPANFRRVIWPGGVLLVAAGAGCALFWLWARPILWPPTITHSVALDSAQETSVAEVPADTREVCRELVRQHSGEATKFPRAGSEIVPPVMAQASQFDNQSDSSLEFARDIHPLLANYCYRCHGPDRQEAGIRFDRRETVFGVTESGTIPVIAGDPHHSELVARITAADSSVRMPPGAPPLTPEDVLQLRQWISAGASWPEDAQHWSFVKPLAVPLPDPSTLNGLGTLSMISCRCDGRTRGSPTRRRPTVRR